MILLISGCGTTNTKFSLLFNKDNHPQEQQDFANKRPPKDNEFIKQGGIKKSKSKPQLADIPTSPKKPQGENKS